MEMNMRFTYLTFLSVLCLFCQNYGAAGMECEILSEPNGVIVEGDRRYDDFTTNNPWTRYWRYTTGPWTRYWRYTTRDYDDYYTGDYYETSPPPYISKCWIIKVPQGSYCRLVFKRFRSDGYNCDHFNLKIDEMGSDNNYSFCAGEASRPKSFRALNDISITISRYTFRSSRVEISYSTESIICAQKDHFRCSPSQCIYQYQVCNGVKDCPNGADEIDCGYSIASIKGMDVTRDRVLSWMKNQRLHSSGWGKNTPRAVTALYLAQPDSFTGNSLEDEVIVKQLELQTSVALLRNSSDPLSVNQLAMFVNALAATCHNPRSFYGYDLVQILFERASFIDSPVSSSPSAFLTLCSLNRRTFGSYEYRLLRMLDRPSKYLFHTDVQAMAVMALTCAKEKWDAFKDSPNDEKLYNRTIEKFISGQLSDGSFGNVYTTAWVTQALIASGQESNTDWNKTATAQYLMRHLNSSTIDFLSAYLTLPIFNGKTLVDLADVDCSNSSRKPGEDDDVTDVTNKLGGKINVKYSLIIGDQKDVVQTLILRVPENSTAYDVMRVAQTTNPKFKFHHRDIGGQMYVYEIASMINDPEAGTFWLLYTAQTRNNGTLHFLHHTESPDKLILGNDWHLIMWYKSAQVVDLDLD